MAEAAGPRLVSDSATVLEVEGIGKAFGPALTGHVAIDGISFSISRGEFVSIVGPSGCGKTTLIKLIAGLMAPTTGVVRMFGHEVSSVPDNLAVVFQDYGRSLFPWLRVAANVAFPLEHLPLSRQERRERVHSALAAVGLSMAEGKYPWELSGGMQQRVAIARAIACQPHLLLMDEPFASVDAQTRADLEDLALEVHRRHNMTTLFITHDIDEAVYLADRILVLRGSPGRLMAEITVDDLPAARDQIATKELAAFVRLRTEVARLVRTAVLGADAGHDNDAPIQGAAR
jgi:NitT/TauT family transport system ATP-binding protein